MITVYYSPVLETPENSEFVSELRYNEPTTVYKTLNTREFFGLGATMCPAIVDELKNTFAVTSPIDFHCKFNYETQQATSKYEYDYNWMLKFIGIPNEEHIHQLQHPCYLFYSDTPLTVTQMHPYYSESQFAESTMSITGTYNIESWLRPLRPAFKFKTGKNEIDIVRHDPLCYFKFNTDEKIKLVRFDSTELFETKNSMVYQCLGYKGLKANRLIPTPLKECYEVFRKHNYKKRIMKYIKENLV